MGPPRNIGETTPNPWAAAVVADPYSAEIIYSRLKELLKGNAVGNVNGITKGEKPVQALEGFVLQTDWACKPEAFDALWHATFKMAKKLHCTERIRDATYFWTEQFLLYEAEDAIPQEAGDEEESGLIDGYDKTWIATAVGDARLYALGYGYSAFAWNAFLDGLGLGGEEANSDSMRIASCGQLLGAGQRLKLRIHGGGDKHSTPGFAGRYLKARPSKTEKEKKEREEFWGKVLKALEDQQQQAGPKAAALLQKTLEHLQADADDMTSVELNNTMWPEIKMMLTKDPETATIHEFPSKSSEVNQGHHRANTGRLENLIHRLSHSLCSLFR